MQSTEKPVPSRLPRLAAIAALLLLVLLILPATGWLARAQLGLLVGPPRALISLLKDLGVKEAPGIDLKAASEEPVKGGESASADYNEQLCAAIAYQPGADATFEQQRVDRLRALANRFPAHRSAVYAHALRYATMGLVKVNRDDEFETYMTGKPPQSPLTAKPSSPEAVATFIQDAAEGEKSDPSNAYFPMMQAVGLFAAKRDAEALEAVKRAGRMTRFEDYSLEEPEAQWQRLQRRNGRQTVIVRAAVAYATLFPHFAPLRAAARLNCYKAVQAEAAGHKEEGFAIRDAMMRCGSLMRVQSRSTIGNLVGMAIVPIQTSRPGAALPSSGMTKAAWGALTNEQRTQHRIDAFYAYLQQIGHPEEADWTRKEFAAAAQAKEILDQGTKRSSAFAVSGLSSLTNRWFPSIILLANALEMLILCGAMLALKALRRDRGVTPLFVVGLLCAAFCYLAFQMKWAPALTALRQVAMSLSSDSDASGDTSVLATQGLSLLATLCVLIVPFFTLIYLGVTQVTRRDAPTSAVATGLQRGGAVIALLLVVAYAVALIPLTRFEANANQEMDRMLQHEGRYYAQSLGKTWPP